MASTVLAKSRSDGSESRSRSRLNDEDADNLITDFIFQPEGFLPALTRVQHNTPPSDSLTTQSHDFTLPTSTPHEQQAHDHLAHLLESYATALDLEIQRAEQETPSPSARRDIDTLFDIRVREEFKVPVGAKPIHDGSTTGMQKMQRFFRKLGKILRRRGVGVIGWIWDVLRGLFLEGGGKSGASVWKAGGKAGGSKVNETGNAKPKASAVRDTKSSSWLPSLFSPSTKIEGLSSLGVANGIARGKASGIKVSEKGKVNVKTKAKETTDTKSSSWIPSLSRPSVKLEGPSSSSSLATAKGSKPTEPAPTTRDAKCYVPVGHAPRTRYALVSNPKNRFPWRGDSNLVRFDESFGAWREVSWKGGFKGDRGKGSGDVKARGKAKSNWRDIAARMAM